MNEHGLFEHVPFSDMVLLGDTILGLKGDMMRLFLRVMEDTDDEVLKFFSELRSAKMAENKESPSVKRK